MSFFRNIIVAILLAITSIGFFGTTFAEPTTRDLNLKYDATNGTTRDGYIESFK